MNAPGRFVIVLGWTCLAALTACGGESATSSDEASPDTVESAPAPTADVGSQSSTPEDETWGRPLDRPERYYGVYAESDQPERQWFVKKAERPAWAEQAPEVPPGHLAIGAMFGDVAPWSLKTLSETEFAQIVWGDSPTDPVTVEFEFGDDGRAESLQLRGAPFDTMGRLVRQGDLPEDWQ